MAILQVEQAQYIGGFIIPLSGVIWVVLDKTLLRKYNSKKFQDSVIEIRSILFNQLEKGKRCLLKNDSSIKSYISNSVCLSDLYFDAQYDYAHDILWGGVALIILIWFTVFLLTLENQLLLIISILVAEFASLLTIWICMRIAHLRDILSIVELSPKAEDWNTKIVEYYKKNGPIYSA